MKHVVDVRILPEKKSHGRKSFGNYRDRHSTWN